MVSSYKCISVNKLGDWLRSVCAQLINLAASYAHSEVISRKLDLDYPKIVRMTSGWLFNNAFVYWESVLSQNITYSLVQEGAY